MERAWTIPALHRPGVRSRWKVFVACTPTIMIQGFEVSMINIALPSIGGRMSAELADLQWVVAAFALALVSLLPTSAAIGDLYGRRRALLAGYGVFALGTVVAWSATSMSVLLPGRIAQGVGMGLGAPNSLAMVALAFPPEKRGRALGLWTAISSVGFTISPILGGWLVESFGFSAVFLPFLLVAAVGAAGTWLWMPADPRRQAGKIDLRGIALGTGALSLLCYGLIEGGRGGFGQASIGAALVVGVSCAVWFARHELRVEHPMLDLRLMRRPSFGPVLVATFALNAAGVPLIFLLNIYLQALRGFSPSATGWFMMSFSATALLGALIGGHVTDRIGFRMPVAVALPVMGLAAFLLAAAGPTGPVGVYVPVAMGLAGAVSGAFFVAVGAAAVRRVPEEQTSAAAAALSAFRQLGGVVGITLFGAMATIVARARFRGAIAGREDAVARASSVSFGVVPEGADQALAAASADASFFAHTVVMAVIGAGALAVGGGILLSLFKADRSMSRRARRRSGTQDAEP